MGIPVVKCKNDCNKKTDHFWNRGTAIHPDWCVCVLPNRMPFE